MDDTVRNKICDPYDTTRSFVGSGDLKRNITPLLVICYL